MKQKLTVKSVEAVQPADKDVIVWDTEVPGFFLKVTPAGRRSFGVYYRTCEKQQRRPMIGVYGSLRPEAARAIAREWLAEVPKGNDPSLNRTQARKAPTVRDLCHRYMDEHARARKKASSIENDRRLIEQHIAPALGSKKVASVARADVAALHHRMRDTPYHANRMLALASKMFGLAERWGLRPDGTNPATNIDRFKEVKREQFLSPDELEQLWTVLDTEPAALGVSPSAVAAIKLLILTGRRVSEILGLQWQWLDLENGVMRLPDTKTGALTVSLAQPTIDLLKEIKEAIGASIYVIPGRVEGASLVNLNKPWRKIRELAGLDDVRIHDLRHTYASYAAGLGFSLPVIGRLLGHTQPATTARYAHLAMDPVKAAVEAIGSEISRIVSPVGPKNRP